jgi:probable F420-dependent oxidoreductase
MQLGRFGIWRRYQDGSEHAAAIEELGYSAIWVGGSPMLADVRPFLETTGSIAVVTGILNVWRNEPAAVAAGNSELRSEFGDRFLLGIGIGHPEATAEYKTPLAKMREFFDGLDSADPTVPVDERLMAALGPKMLDLSAERSLGTHPYFTSVEHTRFARERIGPDKLSPPRWPSWSTPIRRAAGPRRASTPRSISASPTTRATCCASASPSRTSRTAAATA